MRRAWCVLVLVLGSLPSAGADPANAARPTAVPRVPPSRSISWLTIGDSYGAGEGATRASGHCQQSPNASGPKAAAILRGERAWKIGPQVFAACTGYLAADLFNSRDDLNKQHYTTYGAKPGMAPRSAQVHNDQSLYDWAMKQHAPRAGFDVVVSSLGGNDIGFADVVGGCIDVVRRLVLGANALVPNVSGTPWETFVRAVAVPKVADRLDEPGCGNLIKEEMDRRIDALFAADRFPPGAKGAPNEGRRESLDGLYRTAASTLLAQNGVMVVLGYPRLITPSKTWGAWRGNQCNLVTRSDADRLGELAELFDAKMREHLQALDPRIEYVSRLQIFDDNDNYHSLCGRGVEWLNTPLLFLRDGTARWQRGFHPNDLGYLAIAERVAGTVEARLGVTPPAPTSAPPSVRSSEAHYDVGEEFSAQCTVAWPTAPSRGVDSILMRTSCPGVPQQFLFVDIQYGDPDLPVTPSRSTMRVHGRIVDIVRSEYGFTTLSVLADRVELL